ncbi:hypothetical protein VB774_20170 [Pseudanabaena galeata UHCC 0370]|uniref:Uncharacterized protein n=1 Tax=Pseudanabaena galeata UHCC 0370 TaxID=3110310 RepID=A0ABU5TNN1_9CYAN|nr:hypothetical protein [Pseudanabaena galeata]MEA5479950.1 hypothetical protein [Pseudanabaena galeata UHCC 0370]
MAIADFPLETISTCLINQKIAHNYFSQKIFAFAIDSLAETLNKIIELERANNLKQASELQTKLQTYELQYQMPSEIFYQRFSEGSLGDEMDYLEWGVIYELWKSVQERLQVLQSKRQ